MRYDETNKRLTVSVGELVTLARRGIPSCGDTERDAPSSVCDKRRQALLFAESRELLLDTKIGEHEATVVGVADSVDGETLTVVREVQPYRGEVSREDKEIARGEGFLLAYVLHSYGVEDVKLRTVYLNRDGEVILDECEQPTERALTAFFDKCISVAEVYATPEIDRVTKRLPAFRSVKFPYDNVREGQRDFIHAVYRTLARGTRLYASAPTGTGKTVSVLYPAIKALGDGRCDKVFYLTPKHTTGEAAKACLDLFAERGAFVRAVTLYSKETLCPEAMVCRLPGGTCRLNYKRLADATLSLYELNKTVVTRADFLRAAREFSVCPHELSFSYSELCDVIICDFNYLFDPQVYLRRYFTEGGAFAFLIDEAHNLPERAREMYSASLSLSELDTIYDNPLIPKHSAIKAALKEAKDALFDLLYPYLKEDLRQDADGKPIGAAHLSELPSQMYTIVYSLLAAAEDAYRRSLREKDEEAAARALIFKELYYNIKKVAGATELFDDKYRLFIFYEGGVLSFKLFCLDTGGVIAKRVNLGHGAVFFSATLEPIEYYRSLLGAKSGGDTLNVGSPFDPSQLSVSIVDKISTRYSERERTAPAVCRAIAAMLSARRGNYMVFCPSFEYVELLSKTFIAKYPKIHTLVQRRDMTAKEKRDFLAEFSVKDGRYLVGFCVLGGIYSEGVDLVGNSLIGAAVVGIGMPQLSYEREAMRDYYNDKYEAGTEYAYLYPGMNKVFQAAGRVIRREDDRGVIVLIDDRFADPIYKKSIPALWHGMRYVGDANELKDRILDFWRRVDDERK